MNTQWIGEETDKENLPFNVRSCQSNGLDNHVALLIASACILAAADNEPFDIQGFTTSVTLVSEITSTKILGHLTKWSEVNNNNNNNKMVRSEPVSSKPGNRRRSAGEQIPQETR